jgi:hypothetical protein
MGKTTKPLPLRKGDVIAIFAPGGPVDPKKLSRGVARLASAALSRRSRTGFSNRTGTSRGPTLTAPRKPRGRSPCPRRAP